MRGGGGGGGGGVKGWKEEGDIVNFWGKPTV